MAPQRDAPPAAFDLAGRLEYATDADPALNYCLWDYPAPAPAADRFRSINLLWQSFDPGGLDGRAARLVEALRDGIGPFRTVYGIKWDGVRLGWEFYFYDYRRLGREVSAQRVLAALSPWVRSEVTLAETLPYFMFSLDLDAALAAGQRPIDVIHMYVGNPGSAVSSGIAYAVRADATRLENFYFFFDGAAGLDEARRKIETSGVVDFSRVAVDEVLRPELRQCRTICVANKQTHDCVYFSGVTVDQLLLFLQWQAYPRSTVDFVARHRDQLRHLLFDVGLDYTMRGGRLTVLKTGYYGVF